MFEIMSFANLYKTILTALNREKINFLLVGGLAVNLYGYLRYTGDLDVILALNKSNLGKFDSVMKKMGYVERLPVSVMELGSKAKLKDFVENKGLKAYTFLAGERLGPDIDIIVGESQKFKDFYKRRSVLKAWGIDLPVVAIDDLIQMKKNSGRKVDLLDLEALSHLRKML